MGIFLIRFSVQEQILPLIRNSNKPMDQENINRAVVNSLRFSTSLTFSA